MDHVSIEAAEALSGESAFILQLRPPTPPGADEAALAARIDQFTQLYISSAGPSGARFAQLAPLTWAIAARRGDGGALELLRGDLCETLFGADDPARATLARQPGAPDAVNRLDQPTAASRAAFDDDNDTFDLDTVLLDMDETEVFEPDAWRTETPSGDEARAGSHGGAAEFDSAPDSGADSAAEDDGFDLDDALDLEFGADSETDVMAALAELERAFGDEEPRSPADLALVEDDGATEPEADWDMAPPASSSSAASPAGGEAVEVDAFSGDALDEGAEFDIAAFAADLDAFEQTASAGPVLDESEDPAAADALSPPASRSLESLTEAPAPRAGDLAAELAAFREEMRAIAESIPGAHAGEALARFREEIESLAGAMGQRVDGAAQRIEAAAERIETVSRGDAADRLSGAAERAELSAAQIERSVSEAVRALKLVLEAAQADRPLAANGV